MRLKVDFLILEVIMSKFLFQTGAIKRVTSVFDYPTTPESFYSKLVRLKVKREARVVEPDTTFLFQTGAIKSGLRLCHH